MKSLKKWMKGQENDQRLEQSDNPHAAGSEPTPTAPSGENAFRFGLGEPVFEDNEPQLDIVAIHGLNGDRVTTWSDGNIFWLRDLLPPTLKQSGIRARIWSYGYNAYAYSGAAVSVQNLWDHGESFLGQLVNRRRITNTEDRPIIFVVHSLGGLILKSALVMSNASNPNHLERNKALKLSTHGIIFCGVPHQGGNNVPEAKILLHIGSVLTNTTTNIVRVLEPGNEVLRTQRDSFTYISNDFFIVNLVETENTPVKVGTRLIVPRDSAVLPGSTGRKYWAPIGVNGKNHTTLVRFSSLQDPGYQILSEQIVLMVREGFRDVNSNWESWRRSLRVRDFMGVRLRPRLPYAPSPRFCGRSDEFKMLEMFMKESGEEKQNVVAIYGAGGIGKTELILQYTYHHQKDYMSVVWINATSRGTAETGFIQAMQDLVFVEAKNAASAHPDFAKIASDLGIIGLIDDKGKLALPEEDEAAVRRVVDGLKAWLAQYVNASWLLVFDNHDDMSFSLRDFFPTSSWGSIIVASRRPAIKSYATIHHHHELEGLDETSAVELLLSISGRDHRDDLAGAQRVVEQLHYFPLAIDQAAAYISLRPHMTFDTYLERYETKAKELLSKNEHPWPDYTKTCMTTWEISREAIREESHPAASLLAVCSFFNNQDIWGEYLRRAMYYEDKLLSGKDIDDAIALLYSYSLIKPKLAADSFSIHGVVHVWGRERLEGDDLLFRPVAAARMMKDAILFVHGQSDRRGVAEHGFERRLLPHLEYFLDTSKAIFGVEGLKKAIQLRGSEGTSKYSSIQATEAQLNVSSRVFRKKALEILDITRSVDYLVTRTPPAEEISPSPLLTQRYFRDMNAKDGPWAQQVVDVQKIAHDSMIILARAFNRQGRHRAAARLELSLIYFLLGTLNNDITPAVAHISNLATEFRETAKYREAEILWRFALAEWPQSHPDTESTLPRIRNNLVVVLSKTGKYQEGEALRSENSSIMARESATLTADQILRMSDQVVNLNRQEKYAEASELGRTVLAWRETNLPSGDPEIYTSLNTLAVVLEKQGLLAEAEQMSKKALEGRQALFSPGHIAIFRSMSNLAVIFSKQNKLNKAAELYQEAIEGFSRYHGDDHDEAIKTRKNLAIVWARQKKFEKACDAFGACAKQLAVKLEIEHPLTLNAINDWANCLIDLERLRGATNLFWYVLQVRLRVLVIDKALNDAFTGLSVARKEYARLGKSDMVKWLDDTVPKHEAQMQAKYKRKQLSG